MNTHSSALFQANATAKHPAIRAVVVPRNLVASPDEAGCTSPPAPELLSWSARDIRARESFNLPENVLAALERGYNTTGGVWMDASEPRCSVGEAFYVLLTVKKGVAHWHTLVRTISQVVSVGAFAFGTGLFRQRDAGHNRDGPRNPPARAGVVYNGEGDGDVHGEPNDTD